MEVLYSTILQLLNSLIPAEDVMFGEFSSLNSILAYFVTIGFIWLFLVKPFINLFNRKK